MAQANRVHSTPPINTSKTDEFPNLAAAVSPAWHQAIVRLANASERVATKLGWILENEQDNVPASVYVKNCHELVDQLLEFLDGLEEDPDLEPTLGFMNGPPEMDECETPEDDEPSLASLDSVANQTKWAEGGMMDAEQDDSDDEPDADGEPSLGSVGDLHFNQERWAAGNRQDLEDDHDGAEPGEDDEPSLASTASLNQTSWSAGDGCDREQGTTRRFREEPKPASICNVTPVSGEWWKLKERDDCDMLPIGGKGGGRHG